MSHRSATHRFPSWLPGALIVILALRLTVATVRVQRPDGALCRGLLGAGFPLPFVCDASGESTTSRWGHMDWADADSINRLGTLIDMMFYGLPLCGGSMLWRECSHPGRRRHN